MAHIRLNANQRMANAILENKGSSLIDFLTERYIQGLSWEAIGRELHVFTDGVISPSYQTVGRWLDDLGIRVEEPA